MMLHVCIVHEDDVFVAKRFGMKVVKLRWAKLVWVKLSQVKMSQVKMSQVKQSQLWPANKNFSSY